MISRCRSLLACCAMLMLAACSSPMIVHYTPIAAVDSLTRPGQTPPAVYVERFADVRQDKSSIGGNKNLYGMTMNSATTKDDLGMIFAEATTDALKKGNILADLHSSHTTGDPLPSTELSGYDALVGGEVREVNVTSRPGWFTVNATAHVSIRVSVTRNGNAVWYGPIEGNTGQGAMGGAGGDIDNAMALALDSAIQDSMRSMITQFREAGILTK